MFQGPYDPHNALLDWELGRWIDHHYTQALSERAQADIRRPQVLGLGRYLYVLAPLLALGVIAFNTFVIANLVFR